MARPTPSGPSGRRGSPWTPWHPPPCTEVSGAGAISFSTRVGKPKSCRRSSRNQKVGVEGGRLARAGQCRERAVGDVDDNSRRRRCRSGRGRRPGSRCGPRMRPIHAMRLCARAWWAWQMATASAYRRVGAREPRAGKLRRRPMWATWRLVGMADADDRLLLTVLGAYSHPPGCRRGAGTSIGDAAGLSGAQRARPVAVDEGGLDGGGVGGIRARRSRSARRSSRRSRSARSPRPALANGRLATCDRRGPSTSISPHAEGRSPGSIPQNGACPAHPRRCCLPVF